MRRFVFHALFSGALSLLAPFAARAGTDTANLAVSASVAASCDISTAPLAFGSYDPVVSHASSALDGTGTVTVTCTSGASATVTLGQGQNPDTGSSESAPARRLSDGDSHYLTYSLYSNAGRTTVWGNTGGSGVAHTGSGSATDLTVYGRLAAAQNVPAGSYGDSVVATVTF